MWLQGSGAAVRLEPWEEAPVGPRDTLSRPWCGNFEGSLRKLCYDSLEILNNFLTRGCIVPFYMCPRDGPAGAEGSREEQGGVHTPRPAPSQQILLP